MDDGVAVFHRQEDTKLALKHLGFNRPFGLTPPEANDLLGRRCYWLLRKLAKQKESILVTGTIPPTPTVAVPTGRPADPARNQPTD
jgi:hypothetical protein